MISDELITFSPKVFIPLTKLCRDVCHYCTFAHAPRSGERAFLTANEVIDIARAGAEAGCTEALFTLGDKPERRYRLAREELIELGHETTISYLAEMAGRVLRETGLLPHLNPGVMTANDIAQLRPVSASMGIMLEGIASSLVSKGGPHFGSPDKDPAARLETIRLAGEARVPFTTGILIGIGETPDERILALREIQKLHRRYGHIQEIIIQNFRAKPGTKMANALEPTIDDLKWTICAAREVFGVDMAIQSPPNLTAEDFPDLIDAGLNDWGGVSPITSDHVNPEAPWPAIDRLRKGASKKGRLLAARLPVYPRYILDGDWLDERVRPFVVRSMDIDGLARHDAWSPGGANVKPVAPSVARGQSRYLGKSLNRAIRGRELSEEELTTILTARGGAYVDLISAADEVRRAVSGDTVSYVVNRNINYTNVCGYRCGFCAFSKGKLSADRRGLPYDLSLDEISRRTKEAWERGATEVCLQGGIHPSYTGETYLSILRAVKTAAPGIHVHAFSPLEISQGAATNGVTVEAYLHRLKDEGLGSLPGTAAEILDDEVRSVLCPDKLSTDEWSRVVETAHGVGLRSTATIMFGHLERPIHQARHLIRLRQLQERTGGITEFVPLPFVHMGAPIFLQGFARRGPTFRETIILHAVARLAFNPVIPNIQASWVKLGIEGIEDVLQAGANDLGGTLMNESISRAAGAVHGQELSPLLLSELIRGAKREPWQRSTLYNDVPDERKRAASCAPPLISVIQTPASKFAHGEAAA